MRQDGGKWKTGSRWESNPGLLAAHTSPGFNPWLFTFLYFRLITSNAPNFVIIQITLTYLIQVLGVLVVAQCHDKDDLHNVKVGFKESCDRFQRTLCDSRCVIYGPKKALEGEVDSHKGYCVIDCNVDLESFTKDDVNVDDLFKVVMDFSRMIYITLKSRIASLHRLENLKVLRSPYEEGLQEQSQDSRYDNFTNYLTMHTYTICIAL